MDQHVSLLMSSLDEIESLVEIKVKGIVLSINSWDFEMLRNNGLGIVVHKLVPH